MGGRGAKSGISSNNNQKNEDKNKKEVIGAVMDYQDLSYEPINQALRNDIKLKDVAPEAVKTDKGMQKAMKKTTEEKTVYRGFGDTAGKQLSISNAGQIITDKAYTSTSMSKKAFKEAGFDRGWTAKITVPKGTKAIDVNKTLGKKSISPHEKELILNKGTKYGIKKIDKAKKTVELIVIN